MNKIKEFFKKTALYPIYKKTRAIFFRFFYGNPQKDLFIVWVTWTDGKTTTVNLIQKILNDNLWKTASLSTALIKVWDEIIENPKKMTSFDPKDLFKYLAIFKSEWVKYVVLEVSSHWIDQFRFHWIDFDMAVLTNISEEHLDYHKNIDEYAEVKKRLFLNVLSNDKPEKYWVLPKDDERGRRWAEELSFDKFLDYGIVSFASVKWENIVEDISKTEFDVVYLWKSYHITSNFLLGKHNVYNILAAISVGLLLGIPLEKIVKSVESFEWLPGRLEKIEKDWKVFFVDFAHTPRALESVLNYLSQVKEKKWWRLIVLFWAPGERDPYKRPLMWQIVDKFADIIVLTDDDPASENRYDIIRDIMKWINRKEWEDFYIIPERKLAVKFVKEISESWDIILLAWKGHENVQLTNFWKRKYSDKEELLKD